MALRLIVDSDDETLYHDEIASANPTYQRYSTNLAGVDNQRRQTLQTSHSLPTNTPVSIASNNAPIAQSSSTKMSLNEQRQRKKHRKQHLLLNSMSKSQSNIQHTPSTRIAYNQANYPGTLSHQNSGKTSTGSSPHQSQHNETKPASSAMAMAQLSPVASHVSHHDFNFNIDTITSKNNTPMKGNFEKMDRDDKDLMIVGGLLQANQDLLANASSMDEYDQEEGIPPKAISSLRKKKRDSLPKASNTSMDVKKKVGVDDDQDAPLVERSMTLDQDESHLWADVNMMSSDSDPDDVKLKMTMRSSTSSPASSHSSSRASSSSASMQAMDDEFDEMPSDDLQPIAPDDSVDQQATAMPPPSTVNKAMPRKASDLTQNDVLLRTGNKQNNEKSQFVDGMGVDNSVMSTSSIMGNDSSYFHHHHQTSFMLFQSPVAYSVESPNMQINDISWVSTNTNRYLHQVPSSSQGGSARSAESSESQNQAVSSPRHVGNTGEETLPLQSPLNLQEVMDESLPTIHEQNISEATPHQIQTTYQDDDEMDYRSKYFKVVQERDALQQEVSLLQQHIERLEKQLSHPAINPSANNSGTWVTSPMTASLHTSPMPMHTSQPASQSTPIPPQAPVSSSSRTPSTAKRAISMTQALSYQLSPHRSLFGHHQAITCVIVINDADREILSGSKDCSIRYWDIVSGECLYIYHGHNSEVTCLASLPNSMPHKSSALAGLNVPINAVNSFASGSADGMILLWYLLPHHFKFQAADFSQDFICQKGTLLGHSGSVTCMASLSIDYLASGSLDKSIRIWNLKTMECCNVLKGHHHGIHHLLALPTGELVSNSEQSFTLRLWNASENKAYMKHGKTCHGHSNLVNCLHSCGKLNSDSIMSKFFITASEDGYLCIWNSSLTPSPFSWTGSIKPDRVIPCEDLHGQERFVVQKLTWLTEEYFLVYCSDEKLRIYNTEGELMQRFSASESIHGLETLIAVDERWIVSSIADDTVLDVSCLLITTK